MNYPPAGSPPPMSPPPGSTPPPPPGGAPQPYYYPPPPPPPKSGSPLKWILIGCGILGGLGLLSCGGCMLWGMMIAGSMQESIQTAEQRIRSSKILEGELGAVKKVTPQGNNQQPGRQDIRMQFRVEGEKKNGTVDATLTFTGTAFKLGSMTLEVDGGDKQIPLEDAAK